MDRAAKNRRLFVGPDETGAVVLYEQIGDERPLPVSVQGGNWDTWLAVVDASGGEPSDLLPFSPSRNCVQFPEPEKAFHAR
jgi:hypothetical protein